MKITRSRVTLLASFTFLIGIGGGYALGRGASASSAWPAR
ncbi:MAG: hypothetical protein BMS9Abin29_2364 [Gemmatimonadota bacterium]|nr:MAG: hypothetical protein BMS9Abin29_2364 [Gemmatimonadota bacterium]